MRNQHRLVSIVLFVTLIVVFTTLSLISTSGGSAFPEIDRARLRITLERSGCFGECPAYRVTIDGEGNVIFTTDRFPEDIPPGSENAAYEPPGVAVAGTYRTRIDRREVDRLVERFRAIGFFGLRDSYRDNVTDLAGHVVVIDTGNGLKSVYDYGGERVGMPPAVKKLQAAIDRSAGTARWIEGLPEVIPQLVADGVHFDGLLGMRLMEAAIGRNDVATMEKLAELGALILPADRYHPLVTAVWNTDTAALDWLLAKGAGSQPEILVSAFAAAVDDDNMKAFDRLRTAGAFDRLDIEHRTRLLGYAARNGNEGLVNLFLSRPVHINGNPRPDRRIPPEDPPLFLAAQGDFDDDRPIAERRRIIRRLLDAGAKADWKDPIYATSVLTFVDDATIAKMLIDAGADPNFRDSYDNEPVIFSVDDEGVALVMADSGLDLRAVRPADGMTLRRWAEYQKWPEILALLDRKDL